MSEKEINERSLVLEEALKDSFYKMLELKKKLGQTIITSNGHGQPIEVSAVEAERLS